MSDEEFDEFDDNDLVRAAERYEDEEQVLNRLPAVLRQSLLPFQREGVLFGARKDGCCLLADEMGLGKTIQAIGIGSLYSTEWPMLVVVPSSLKYTWLEEVQKWLPHLTPNQIHLVRCAEDVPNLSGSKISIVSYGLFQQKRFFDLLQNLDISFNVIVCDEAHYLKNWKSHRTKHVVQLLSKAKRRVLLTGTPALARPEELYNLINSIKPATFGTYTEFCARYCQGHFNRSLKRFVVTGASNLDELHTRLTQNIMIRRLKRDVLSQLPPKTRQKISFEIPAAAMKQVEKVKLKLEEVKSRDSGNEFQLNSCMMELYKETGIAKIAACVGYIKEMLKQDSKFLVFAHHLAMLDEIERELVSSKTSYIRIDGGVSSVMRQELVSKFQRDETCTVALLSIQAAGVGLTLTAASVVVFCELHWTPGVLYQAEDRVHRISQENAVNIYYLIGIGTIDEIMWSKLNKKVDVIGKTIEGKGGDMKTAETGDEDLKHVLACCARSHTTPFKKRGCDKKSKESPGKQKPLNFTPGQTTLTSLLNLSVDDDFADPRIRKPRTSSSQVMAVLSQAQERTDRIQIAKLEMQSKRRRKEGRGKEPKEDRREAGSKKTSKYFDNSASDVVIVSSDEEQRGKCSKRVCTRESRSCIPDVNNLLNKESFQGEPSTSGVKQNPQSLHSVSSEPGIESPSLSLTSPEISESHDDITSHGSDVSSSHDPGGDSDTDLITDRPINSLLFSVSAFTDRIYFYDYSGEYLEVNCHLSDVLDTTSLPALLADNPALLTSAQRFVRHWTNISRTTQSKLYNKILSDVNEEVVRLYEGRVESTTRHTRGVQPRDVVGCGSVVVLARTIKVGAVQSEINQAFSRQGVPLCMKCERVVTGLPGNITILTGADTTREARLNNLANRALCKLPFQGRFCSLDCSSSYGIKANSRCVRTALFDLELGVCQLCGFDTECFLRQLKLCEESQSRVQMLNSSHFKDLSDKQKQNIAVNPQQGLLWQADHIIPVAEGGGECDIQNYRFLSIVSSFICRTLCTICHKKETKKLLTRLAVNKCVESNKQKGIRDIRNFLG